MSLFKSIPLGVTTRELAINQDLKGLIPNEKASSEFLAYNLLAREETLLQMVESAGHGTGRLDTDALKNFMLRVPHKEEQDRIVSVIATWDTAIEKTERLIAAKSERLSHLREQQLIKPKQSTQIKLKTATRESAARNGKRLGRDAIMAVTKQVGMRPMREETISAAIDRYRCV